MLCRELNGTDDFCVIHVMNGSLVITSGKFYGSFVEILELSLEICFLDT